MLDNIDVAILTRVNDLAERYGLKPYDFVATTKSAEQEGKHTLAYETPASGNELREERYEKMLDSIGVDQETGQLTASYQHIIDSLDNALALAPRPRSRF
jgi:hypothetical protein